MPFRKYAASFSPEELDAMNIAFSAAVEELSKPGFPLSEQTKSEIAERILEQATKRGFDTAALKQAALAVPGPLDAGVLNAPRGRKTESLRE